MQLFPSHWRTFKSDRHLAKEHDYLLFDPIKKNKRLTKRNCWDLNVWDENLKIKSKTTIDRRDVKGHFKMDLGVHDQSLW